MGTPIVALAFAGVVALTVLAPGALASMLASSLLGATGALLFRDWMGPRTASAPTQLPVREPPPAEIIPSGEAVRPERPKKEPSAPRTLEKAIGRSVARRSTRELELAPDVACDNPGCEQFGVLGGSHVVVCWRYGADRTRFVKCLACKQRFSARRGTALFQLRLSKAKILDVLRMLADGLNSREIAERTGVCRDSVQRIARGVGDQARGVLELLFLDFNRVQVRMDTVQRTLETSEIPMASGREDSIREAWTRLTTLLHRRQGRVGEETDGDQTEP